MMTADEEKELLELEAQIIRLRLLNNQYARHLQREHSSQKPFGRMAFGQYFGQVRPETWKALITPNTWQNRLLVVIGTALLAVLKKKRR